MSRIAVALVVLAMVAAFAAPSFGAVATMKTMPGGVAIDSMQVSATVMGVDQAKRTVTLKLPNGKTQTFKAAKGMDLSMIKRGDKITATLTDMLAVFIEKAGGKPTATETTTVALMPRGPGAGRTITADTYRVTAKVQYIDMANRTVTITWPNGVSRAVKVAPSVNLKAFKPGDDVVIRYTEALAINLQKPKK